MPEESNAGESQFNLDGILTELGSFGKYQLFLLFLLAFRDSFLSMCNFNYIFTATEVPFRCRIPECEKGSSGSVWSNFSSNSSACFRPVIRSASTCNSDVFSQTEPCDDLVYEDYNSIVAEFDLGCQPMKRTLIGTVHNLGLVFSFVVSGFISDRYGRKVVIVGTPLMVGIAGLLKSVAPNYWVLLVLEFLETALGYGNASMVYSLELVSHKRRVAVSCVADILSNLGGACFGLIAWKIPYWRHMMRAIYAPLLIVVFYIFLVDEGVRWLLAHNRNDEAVRVLNKVAKINKITLSSKAKDMLSKITHNPTKTDEVNPLSQDEIPSLVAVLRSRKILLRVVLMAGCFFCSIFVYTGAIINSTSVSGNKYLNYSIIMLVSIPTRIICALTLTRFGRKAPICAAYCLCACFYIASAFVPKTIWWASVVLYMVGKMCSSYGVFSLSVVAMEVFPTTSRNSLTNIANTVGRLGSVIAPQITLLEKYMTGLPTIVFGAVSLGPAALALILPDTSAVPLPDHLADAEKIDAPNILTSVTSITS